MRYAFAPLNVSSWPLVLPPITCDPHAAASPMPLTSVIVVYWSSANVFFILVVSLSECGPHRIDTCTLGFPCDGEPYSHELTVIAPAFTSPVPCSAAFTLPSTLSTSVFVRTRHASAILHVLLEIALEDGD